MNQPMQQPVARPSTAAAKSSSTESSDEFEIIEEPAPKKMKPKEKVMLRPRPPPTPPPTHLQQPPSPPPQPRRKQHDIVHIQLHTFGVEPLEVEYHSAKDVILRRYRACFDIDLDMAVDARKPFAHPRCKWGHNGHHDAFIESCVNNPDFKDWLAMVKRDFDMIAKTWDPNECFHLGVYCKAGTNRSVAMSLVLWTIFDQLGYNCYPVIHRSQESGLWAQRNACDSSCATCQNGSSATSKKKRALWKAFKAWNTL